MADKNINCLEGVACPACGSQGPFYIQALTWVEVTDDGTGDCRDFSWDQSSRISCPSCGRGSIIADFTQN